jgi:hypothetical protein
VAALMNGPARGQDVLVPAGSVWKYLDDGSDQDTVWRELAFDDGTWASGPAQLGYGDGGEATVVSYGGDPNNKFVTTYFRHAFVVGDPSQYAGLLVRLLRDDGALVYLNGVEIVRSNMPAGSVNYLTLSSSTVSGGDEDIFYQTFVDPSHLLVGTNVLAVEIHQRGVTSSDISFDLELLSAGPMRKAPYLVYTDDNTEMKLLWQLHHTATCRVDWGLDTDYLLGVALTNEYGGDHQHTHTFTGLTPSTKYFYRVVAGTDTCEGTFRSAPSEDATAVKFIAYGDTRTFPADHDQVAEGILSTFDADEDFQSFIISVGDLVGDGDEESQWDSQFFDPSYSYIQTMLGSAAYQATMGNHEGLGVLFTKYFPYPFVAGRYWSFDYGPAHFTVVDQYTSYSSGSAQLAWIESDLAGTTKPWRFILLHEPGWSAGSHGNDATVQNYIQPLCEQYGVSMVFAGHNHYYARAEVNNVVHVTTGGGGAPLYVPILTYPNVVTATMVLHYCRVEIDRDLLTLTAVTPGGAVIDEFTIDNPLVTVPPSDGGIFSGGTSLRAAFPNPFNPSTRVTFFLAGSGDILLRIYDVRGRPVRTLVWGRQDRGPHEAVWDGRDDSGREVVSGVYVCTLETSAGDDTMKIVLLR